MSISLLRLRSVFSREKRWLTPIVKPSPASQSPRSSILPIVALGKMFRGELILNHFGCLEIRHYIQLLLPLNLANLLSLLVSRCQILCRCCSEHFQQNKDCQELIIYCDVSREKQIGFEPPMISSST